MTSENYVIRAMKKEEIAIALNFAEKEGWNPGKYDAESFYAADPKGFFVGLIDGSPISCLSAVAYDDDFGFLGLYIVKPGYRGKGLGMAIWKRALSYLNSRTIGLDGVEAQQGNYRKSGFLPHYKNMRFKTIGRISSERPEGIIPLEKLDFKIISIYDQKIFPAKRDGFLKAWIMQEESNAFGKMRNGTLAGYGVIRKCISGYKIGPLFADDDTIAEELFKALCGSIDSGQEIFLDIPDINPGAMDLAKKNKMEKIFETARMYKNAKAAYPMGKVYCQTTLEIG